MLKKLILSAIAILPATTFAQNQWKLPETLKVNSSRLIEIIGVVDGSVLKKAQQLDKMSTESQEPVYMLLNSPGGSVYAGNTFIDSMEVAKARGVKMICVSGVMAASMAFQMLVHCDERFVLKNTNLLFHPMSMSIQRARVYELKTLVNYISREEREMAETSRNALGMDSRMFYENYVAETLWSAYILNREAPGFLKVVDNIEGLDKLFVVVRENSLFGKKDQQRVNEILGNPTK